MANKEYFYPKSNYDFIPEPAAAFSPFLNVSDYDSGSFAPSKFGVPTDPRTSNQLKAVSDKIRTGVKTIEVSGITPQVLESIPDQHLQEINRLKKLVKIDLTFHGPLIEPTGFQGRQGWQEHDRQFAENQMLQAVQRANKLDPDGNVVVTFHSSNGLMEPESKIFIDDKENNIQKEVLQDFWVIDETTGQFQNFSHREDYFKGGIKKDPKELIIEKNNAAWAKPLQNLSFHAYQGEEIIERALRAGLQGIEDSKQKFKDEQEILKYYKEYAKGNYDEIKKEVGEEFAKPVQKYLQDIAHGHIYLRDAYNDLQELYNKAYETTKINADKGDDEAKESLQKLNKYRDEIKNIYVKLEDPANVKLIGEEIVKGVNVLNSITPP